MTVHRYPPSRAALYTTALCACMLSFLAAPVAQGQPDIPGIIGGVQQSDPPVCLTGGSNCNTEFPTAAFVRLSRTGLFPRGLAPTP